MRYFFLATTLLSCYFFLSSSTAFMMNPPSKISYDIISNKASSSAAFFTSLPSSANNHANEGTTTHTLTSSHTLDIILFGIGDLRTIDHGGLTKVLSKKNANSKILPLFILDTQDTLSNMPMGRTHTYDNASILHSALVSLQDNLKSKFNLDLHVCPDSHSSITNGDKKGVVGCIKDVISQYSMTAAAEQDHPLEKIIIHSCDLGDVDNHIGYGPYKHLLQYEQSLKCPNDDSQEFEIIVQGWDCQLRNQPWNDLSKNDDALFDFPSTFTDYEQIYVRNKEAICPAALQRGDIAYGSSELLKGVTIPSMMSIPSFDDVLDLLCKSLDMDKDDISSTRNTGLYATHWGGLDISSTLNEQSILDVIDTFLGSSYEDIRGDNALVDKFKWWDVATDGCKLKRNPQSLEHASMNWLMTGGTPTQSTRVKTESLIEAELLTRYLAAPLLFGMVSSRYMWNQAEKMCKKNESPFDFFAPYRSSTNAMKAIVENREWHKLFAAKNLCLEDRGRSSSTMDFKYNYIRWHGFLCRYINKTINTSKSSNIADKEGIVLVHGFGASGSQWEKTIDEIEKSIDGSNNDRNIDAFAPDLIGFGQCEKPSLTYTQYLWEGYTADCVKEIGLGKYQWSKFAIGGNSIGGYTAMGVAADDTNFDLSYSSETVSSLGAKGSGKCQGLVLMNSAGRILSKDEINEAESTIAEATAKDMLGLSSPPPRGIAKVGGNGLLAYLRPRIQSICVNLYPTNPDAVDDKLCGGILRDSLDPGAINVMISGSKLPPPRTANELLGADYGSSKSRQALQFPTSVREGSFNGPVLVAQGILDPLNDAKGRADMLEVLRPGITVNRMNGGHCPHDELPGMTANNIVKWMEGSVWSEAIKQTSY